MNLNITLKKVNLSLKSFIGLVLSVAIIVVSLCLPSIGNLSELGVKTIGLLLAFIVCLITEALPIVVISLLFIGLMAVLGVSKNLQGALSGFSQPVVFFTLASFGLTAAFTTTPLAKRILRSLLRVFNKNINLVFLAVMGCTALVSSIISNVPTCAVFSAIGLNFLNLYDSPEDKNKTGKAFMIGIPLASMIGGMMTPAGSPINLIGIGLLEEYTSTTITFVQWMAAGIPLALIMLPLAWLLVVKIYKPAEVSQDKIKDFISKMDVPSKMDRKEILTVIIALTMLVLWILSSWFPFFNVMVIAILGCALLFFPGINILTVDTFLKENSWEAFFLVGTVLSLGTCMKTNGVMDAIVSLIPQIDLNVVLVLAIVAVVTFLCLIILPVATSLISILGTPMMAIGMAASVNPILVIFVVSFCCCNCYLLPLDTVTLITYGKGYYSMTDMAKCTSILQVFFVIIVSLWISLVGLMFGLI